MRAVYLHHGEPDDDGPVGVLDNKIASMVVDPVARVVQVAFGCGLLALRCRDLELHRLHVPAVNSIKITDPTTESF